MSITPKMKRKSLTITDVSRNNKVINYITRDGQVVFHKHEGSPETGGGCYTKPVYHVHNDSCYITSTCGGQMYCVYGSHYVHQCRKCGRQIVNSYIAHLAANPGENCYGPPHSYWNYNPCNSSIKTLICGKTEGKTVEYYLPNCNYSYNESELDVYSAEFGIDSSGHLIETFRTINSDYISVANLLEIISEKGNTPPYNNSGSRVAYIATTKAISTYKYAKVTVIARTNANDGTAQSNFNGTIVSNNSGNINIEKEFKLDLQANPLFSCSVVNNSDNSQYYSIASIAIKKIVLSNV